MMQRNAIRLILTLATLLGISRAASAQEIVATPQKPLSLYEIGERIAWQVELRGEGTAGVNEIRYVLKKNGAAVLRQGSLPLTAGKGVLETSLDEPGAVFGELTAALPQKQIKRLIGAAVAPSKIRPSAPRPDDFDAFWSAKIAQLSAIPANPVLEPADSGNPAVEYSKVRMDNIRGSHLYGQLARPKREGKFPAMLIVQWAGVYGLPKGNVVSPAARGWLALNIMAHDLPFDQPEEFYKQANTTTLKDYVTIGNEDRETSYFLRMYLSCYRAAEYLSQRPDWDGRTLVVTGTSQGGLQTIITAGLHPKITAAMACVPAGCDTTSPRANRAQGWPYWLAGARGKNPEKVLETSRYFDAVNFASRVKCPVLVGMGLVDTTCPPSGVFSMLNQLQGPKEVVVMPDAGHKGDHRAYYPRFEAWSQALLRGQAPPVQAQ